MSLEEKVVKLLHERIGFNPESVGSKGLLNSVRAKLSGLKIADPERFLHGLQTDNSEFRDIVNAVVIPETWFFRDGGPFEYLQRYIQTEHPLRPGEMLHCLSVPSSTGEEPYSIAMALLDAGLTPKQFSIDAVDISAKSLERAKIAEYGPYSFRGSDLSFRDRYFEPIKHGHRLKREIRSAVKFSYGNLLDADFMNDGRKYDIIFCRNLLIYFDPAGWTRALQILSRLLKDSGLLFMGHAELLELNSTQFESVRAPLAFAYRKKLAKPPEAPALKRPGTQPREKTVTRKTIDKQSVVRPKTTVRERPIPRATCDEMLDEATTLSDRGEFKRAGELCRRCLAQHPSSARAHFLLGLIAESTSVGAEAEEHYRRALYLDNKHHEAMIHLSLLLEGRGEESAAANLRARAKQVRPK